MTIEHYNNTAELLAACDQPLRYPQGWESRQRSSRREASDFHANTDYEGAKALASKGWPDGLARITQKIAVMHQSATSRELVNDIAGHFADVPRFLLGLPDCMKRRAERPSNKRPVFDMVINATHSSSITADQIMNYGAAIASIVDALEANGYSVGITIATAAMLKNKARTVTGLTVRIKNNGDPLDLDRLIFYTAHPAFLRRLAFSHMEVKNKAADIGSGYGSPAVLPEADRKDATLYLAWTDDHHRCKTEADALAFVRAMIRQQQPELLEAA